MAPDASLHPAARFCRGTFGFRPCGRCTRKSHTRAQRFTLPRERTITRRSLTPRDFSIKLRHCGKLRPHCRHANVPAALEILNLVARRAASICNSCPHHSQRFSHRHRRHECIRCPVTDPAEKVFVRQDLLDANPGRPGAPVSIPGYPIETASSGIKAPQYFAPGVAGDHGEPIAQYIAVGTYLVPNNLSANAHGNGYADPNIFIPEILESVQVDGGAYNVRQGNHSVNLAAVTDFAPISIHSSPSRRLSRYRRGAGSALGVTHSWPSKPPTGMDFSSDWNTGSNTNSTASAFSASAIINLLCLELDTTASLMCLASYHFSSTFFTKHRRHDRSQAKRPDRTPRWLRRTTFGGQREPAAATLGFFPYL